MEKMYGTDRDVAERYGPSRRSLQRLRATGGGPRWSRVGERRVIYRFADVEEWLAKRSFETRAAELAERAEQKQAKRPPRHRRRPAEAPQNPQ